MKDRKPEPVAVAYQDGGDWHRFYPEREFRPIYSVLFEDGSIFDAHNGWRPRQFWKTREAVRLTLKEIDRRAREYGHPLRSSH